MNELETTLSLEEVAQRLDKAGIAWAVFAGAAASVYGATRPVTDVDVLIPAAEGTRAASLFPGARVERGQDGTVEWIQLPGFDILAGLARQDAEATYALDLDAEMAARLTHGKVLGVTVPVIPPEDNILLKAMWGRGSEVGKHDWEDVQAMMAHLPALDWAYLRWRAGACGPGERLARVLECLESLAADAMGSRSMG
ncbi:MAG: nucleotidyltransferase family protein [Anaerolineae bacterium]|nr:MAG: nucleotidyltransferase family protein [Anaerolineae bacterium]